MSKIEEIKKNYVEMREIVQKQYSDSLGYVKNQRVERRNIHKKLLPKPSKVGRVASRTMWRTQKVWMAITTLDGINVSFSYNGGNVQSEIMKNENLVAQFDYKAMGMFDIDWNVKWNVGLLGLGCKAYIGWDSIEKKPIAISVSPLDIIPEAGKQHAHEMSYIGFELRDNIYNLKEKDGFFGIDDIIKRKGKPINFIDLEKEENEEALLNANNYEVSISQDGTVDLYHHYIFYEGKKYLTVWLGNRSILVKIVEIEPKTKAEKEDPRKIKYPVVFYRSNPIAGLFFGASFHDEIGQFSDVEVILDNLELMLAKKVAMGEDKFINTSIVDVNSIKNKTPGGRLIPVKLGTNDNINNSIFSVPEGTPGQFPQYVSTKNRSRLEETGALSSIAFGVSASGSQTKAEVQTLQQNMNTIFSYNMLMLLESEKKFWEIWHDYYIYNLSGRSKKFIAITKSGNIVDNYEFKKSDFVIDFPVLVDVESKQEVKNKKEKKFARFQVVMGTILQNLKQGSYSFNEMLREYLTLADIPRNEVTKYVPFTIDELGAIEGLKLLEKGEKPISPKSGQDYDTFINYYSFAKESSVREEIIQEYVNAKKNEQALTPNLPQEVGNVDNVSQGQVGNMLMSQDSQNQNPSLQSINQ